MRRASSRSDGFTLIEVIVAIAIFSVMVVLAGTALNQGLRQYKGLMDEGLNLWDYTSVLWLGKSFGSAIDYYVQPGGREWVPYFDGRAEGVSYVSQIPFSGSFPVAVWLQKKRETDGTWSLLYYETPVGTKGAEELKAYSTDGRRVVGVQLLTGVTSLQFSYYGYDTDNERYGWFKRFEGSRMKRLPEQIRIFYVQDGQPDMMLFGVNITSLEKTKYNDD